jgi:hypothetical protein
MKAKHVCALVLGGIAVAWFVWAIFAWGNSPKYDSSVSAETIQKLLSSRGLETCSEKILGLDKTPGFVRGKAVTTSTNCGLDENPLQLTLLEFDSEEARNAAQQRAAGAHRNGYGPHFAYSYGPYVVTVQGNRGIGDQILLGRILREADN